MSQAATEFTGLVRLTMVGGERRVDLAVPGALPVADLLPELAEAVGVLDAYTVHGGYRLVRPDGVVLASQAGLTAQGVHDGTVLTVELGVDDEPERVYDDVVEAVADTVESQTRPWDPAASRRTAMATAALLLVVAALALALERGLGLPVVVAGSALAVLLVAGAALLSRAQHVHDAALVLAWLAVPHAMVAGVAAAPEQPLLGLPLALAGLFGLLTGVLGMLALAERRAALLPALVLGACAGGSGVALAATALNPAPVVAIVLGVALLAGSLVPWLAVSATRVRTVTPRSDSEIELVPPPVNPDGVADQVRQGRGVLVSLTVSLGVLVVFAAPLIVTLGVSGTLLGVCACAVMALRTRQYRGRHEVLAGAVSATASVVVLAVSTALAHPEWRPIVATVLVVVASVLLVGASVPRSPNVRLGRFGDIAEGAALIAVLPLLALAVGLVDAVRT